VKQKHNSNFVSVFISINIYSLSYISLSLSLAISHCLCLSLSLPMHECVSSLHVRVCTMYSINSSRTMSTISKSKRTPSLSHGKEAARTCLRWRTGWAWSSWRPSWRERGWGGRCPAAGRWSATARRAAPASWVVVQAAGYNLVCTIVRNNFNIRQTVSLDLLI
jgi:hypothetical protein